MLARLFILWLAGLPLFVWKFGYEGPKVFYFFLGSIFLSAYWIKRILGNFKAFAFTKADGLYFIWLLILTIASLSGVHPFESIIGGSYRHQGVIFFLGLWLVGKTISIVPAGDKKFLIKATAVVV